MKPEWGHKHVCTECGAHFYDMRKPDPCCPKCKTPADDKAILQVKQQEVEEPPEPDIVDALDDFDDLDEEGPGEEEFIEDADELVGDDDTDMSEIREHMETGEDL